MEERFEILDAVEGEAQQTAGEGGVSAPLRPRLTCDFLVTYYFLPVDDVFKALADGNRRKLLDRLFKRDGQTLGELCERRLGNQGVDALVRDLDKLLLLRSLPRHWPNACRRRM